MKKKLWYTSEDTRNHSWTILAPDIALKRLDKSAFLHHGTGIPIDIRKFFNSTKMVKGERREIFLEYNTKRYQARIEMDNHSSPRTRLFWKADFADLIRKMMPQFYSVYKNDGEVPIADQPKLHFQRLDEALYIVKFLSNLSINTLKSDIESEFIEESGPRMEGNISYYYGKRYERNPINRQRAIEIHGLSCVICGFNFEETYGQRGAGFIEVHHTKPLSTLDGVEQVVDPKTDLVPVCANCHRVIHRKHDDILSIEQMKEILNRS